MVLDRRAGATVFRFAGDAPPAQVEVAVGPDVPPGTRVWLTAPFYSPRAEAGPLAGPVAACTQFTDVPRAA